MIGQVRERYDMEMDKVLFSWNEENGMFLLSAAEIRGWKILLQDWNTEQPNSVKACPAHLRFMIYWFLFVICILLSLMGDDGF